MNKFIKKDLRKKLNELGYYFYEMAELRKISHKSENLWENYSGVSYAQVFDYFETNFKIILNRNTLIINDKIIDNYSILYPKNKVTSHDNLEDCLISIINHFINE